MQASFSLFELNQHIRRVLTFNLQEPLWIKSEIAEVNFHKGNCYLSLVERDEYQLKARADGYIWANQIAKMQEKLPQDGIQQLLRKGRELLMLVQVEFQEQYGLRLAVKEVDLAYTLGKLEQDKLETWAKLEQAQLTDRNKQLHLPTLTQRIAVISSQEAAGYQDFCQQLQNNPFKFRFSWDLFPAAMQGANVGRDFANQIRFIESQKSHFDCIVVVRGGGAKLDLAAFDEFLTAGAVANAPLPVLTGIGHDSDLSLTDKVAHTCLKTPTAVADFLVNKMLINSNLLQSYKQRLQQALQLQLSSKRTQLERLKSRFSNAQLTHILQRGFAVLMDAGGNRLSSAAQLAEGEEILAILADGQAELLVKKLQKKPK